MGWDPYRNWGRPCFLWVDPRSTLGTDGRKDGVDESLVRVDEMEEVQGVDRRDSGLREGFCGCVNVVET